MQYFLEQTQVAASPTPSAGKISSYDQYHEVLDQHKQKMADGERNMDEWNKGLYKLIRRFIEQSPVSVNQGQKASPYIQVYQKPVPGNQNLRRTPR